MIDHGKMRRLMNIKYASLFTIFLIFSIMVFYWVSVSPTLADNDGGEGGFGEAESENEGGQILGLGFGEEGGGALGGIAITVLIISFAFPVLRRGTILTRRYLSDDEFSELKKTIQEIYQLSKKPLFYLHVVANGGVIAFGTLHALTVELENGFRMTTGILALGTLFILSISGLIMWIRLRPLWDHKETRKVIRWFHSQWLLTGLVLLFLFLHIGLGELGGD